MPSGHWIREGPAEGGSIRRRVALLIVLALFLTTVLLVLREGRSGYSVILYEETLRARFDEEEVSFSLVSLRQRLSGSLSTELRGDDGVVLARLRGKAVRCSIADRNVDLASCSVTVDVDTGGYAIVRFRDGEWVSTESSEK